MGPFRQMDAMGLDFLRGQVKARDAAAPALLTAAHESFYRTLNSGPRQLTLEGDYVPVEPVPGTIDLPALHVTGKALETSADAAIVDIGHGVLLLEFRAKMNTPIPAPSPQAPTSVPSRTRCRRVSGRNSRQGSTPSSKG
jgi:3-hydroxyacyl-CoA dehydrogenase